MKAYLQATAAILFLFAGCSDEEDTLDSSELFSSGIRTIVIEVDYATGAEPYTGTVNRLGDIWDIFGDNADRIFSGTKTIMYPNELSQMEELTEVSGASYSADEILAIADENRDRFDGDGTAAFYFVWLDGFFRDGDEVIPGVIGVSIGGTGVIAMFKPVIESVSLPGGGQFQEQFAEQTTLVHEFGHAVGLVNIGVPLTSDHHDVENGAHCTNRDCVMYWANEGLADLVPFVQTFLQSGSNLLFGQECLDDVDALTSL